MSSDYKDITYDVTNGVVRSASSLSCANTNTCLTNMPTFAVYDLLSGAPESDVGSNSVATTTNPGNFGPIGHSVANVVVLDWEGDGTFETSVLVTSAITKTYTTTGLRTPKIRARNNAETPSTALSLTLPLNIIP